MGTGIRLRIHPSFIVYLVILALADGFMLVVSLLLSLVLHEAAHLITGFLLHEAFDRIDITPFGGIISYSSGRSSSKGWKGILVAASGPAANYGAILALSSISCLSLFELQKKLISINASMLIINLLPVLPLDGGRIVFNIGYYLLPVTSLLAVLAHLGRVAGLSFIVLALYGCISYGKLNISLLLIGVYILASIRHEHTTLLLNNQYAVLHERIGQDRGWVAVKAYYANNNEPLLRFLPHLSKQEYCLCLTRVNGKLFAIDEEELCKTLMELPDGTINDAIIQHKESLLETF